MPGTNEFKLFCTGAPGTADSLTPAAWAALTAILANGFQTGVADSSQANTAWRQASTASVVIGELIARSGQDALDNRDPVTLASELLTALTKLLPVAHVPGDIKICAYLAATAGWIPCDGRSLLRTDYINLFNAISTVFGAVDINHFSMPDMRGMFPRGYDCARGVDPGRIFGTYQADAMPAHVHSVDLQPLNSNSFGGSGKVTTGNDPAEGVIPPFNTSSTGSGSETRVKNLALNFFICAGPYPFNVVST